MKGRSVYLSKKDLEAIDFLLGIYEGHIESGAWEEENDENEKIKTDLSELRKKHGF